MKKIDTKIYEVENLLPPMKTSRSLDKRLPPLHFFMIFIAKSKSGKSNFIANYLLRDEFIGMGGDKPLFEVVHVISPSIKSDKSMQIYRQDEVAGKFSLHEDIDNIESIIKEIVESQRQFDCDSKDPADQPPNICIYIDDCSKYINKSKYIEHFFTIYRHLRISIILSLQNIKGMPPICRSQATGVFLSRVYDDNERDKISEHFSESFKGKQMFYNIWDQSCDKFYSFLFLNFADYYPRAFKWSSEVGLQEFVGIYPEEEKLSGNLDAYSDSDSEKEDDEPSKESHITKPADLKNLKPTSVDLNIYPSNDLRKTKQPPKKKGF